MIDLRLLTGAFGSEVEKLASVVGVPPVPRTLLGVAAKSGAAVKVTSPVRPAVTGALGGPKTASTVPTSTGKNLATKLIPKTNTVPNATHGGSLVR